MFVRDNPRSLEFFAIVQRSVQWFIVQLNLLRRAYNYRQRIANNPCEGEKRKRNNNKVFSTHQRP